MKQEEQAEVYRVAFETAHFELKEIAASLEQLRLRKDHIEKLVEILGPLVELEEKPKTALAEAATGTSEVAGQSAQDKHETAPAREIADPFQRRIEHVLGIGAGIRDVRKYTRQF
jgi:hypothetical protein